MFLVAPGPVRQLHCSYDTLRKEALLCEWEAPEHSYAHIRAYNVNVTVNGTVVMKTESTTPRMESNLLLRQEDACSVSVSAVTHREGEAASIGVNFTNSGMFTPPLPLGIQISQ